MTIIKLEILPLPSPEQKVKSECLVNSALGLVLRISLLAGVAPLKFKREGSSWKISISAKWSLVGYVITTIINVGAIVAFGTDLQVDVSKSIRGNTPFKRLLWMTYVTVNVLAASVAGYNAPARIKKLIECMNRIQKINSYVCYKTNSVNQETAKCLLLGSSVVILIIVCACDYWVMWDEAIVNNRSYLTATMYFFYYLTHIMAFLVNLQFIVCSMEVWLALKSMNDFLEQILQPWSMSSQVKFGGLLGVPSDRISKSVEGTIRHLSLMFGTVCEVIKELDSCNGAGIILVFMSCIMHTVLYPYVFLANLFYPWVSPVKMYVQFNWFVFQFVWVLAVVEPCHLTTAEMDRCNILVSKLSIERTEQIVSYELDNFSRYLLLNKISYTPLGICTLKRSLVTTIISSVTTYLVILIQFPAVVPNLKRH